MLVHRRGTPSIKFTGNHLYKWVERGTVRLKCLAKQNSNNTMSSARARTRASRSAGESSKLESAVPLILHIGLMHYCLHMTGSGKVVIFDIRC